MKSDIDSRSGKEKFICISNCPELGADAQHCVTDDPNDGHCPVGNIRINELMEGKGGK